MVAIVFSFALIQVFAALQAANPIRRQHFLNACLLLSPTPLLAQLDLSPDPPTIVEATQEAKSPIKLDPPWVEQVTTWLSQLEKGSLDEREAAEQGLLELGPSVLAYLPRLPSSVGGDYRQRLDRIRDSMQSKAIGEYAQPSTVTLNGKLPASDVLLEIMEQTDNQLTIERIPEREMIVHFERTLFWEALDSVLDELKLEATTSPQDASLKLVPSPSAGMRSERGAYAGVFRIEPRRVDATRSVQSDQLSRLSLEISLMWEPRLRPVYFHFPMKSVLVECDNGELLSAASPDASPEYTPTDAHSIEAVLMVNLPTRNAKSIRRLSGTLMAAIPGATVQLEFDALEAPDPKSLKVGNLHVSIERTKKRDELYEFDLLIRLRDAGQTMDSFRGWLMSHEAYVMNAKGERVVNAGWQTYQMNSEAVGLTYFFDLGPSLDGCRLIYSAPGAVNEQRVDFILKDIPLP